MNVYAYAAGAAICFLILWLLFWFAAWEEWDDRRRSDRLVHRNLRRMSGR